MNSRVVQVLAHIGERIAELHRVGFAHRDLKPSNIVWQPLNFTWVLIDFGLIARIGALAKVGFTPPYAAPEVVDACLKGERYITVDAAVDAWALGVIAFELLVERPAFGPMMDAAEVLVDLPTPSPPNCLQFHVVSFSLLFLPFFQDRAGRLPDNGVQEFGY
jgi:serine/threonine protein kinase